MATPPNPKHKPTKLQSWVSVISIILGVIVIAGLAWSVVFLYQSFSQPKNYAEEVAQPLEEALTRAGVVKKCSRGDSGRGWDNREPWYYAIYESSLNSERAAGLVKQAAMQNGYRLNYEQSSYSYINWYVDDMSKKSYFSDLMDGNISIRFAIYSDGNNLSCEESKVSYDKQHAAIRLTVSLPALAESKE